MANKGRVFPRLFERDFLLRKGLFWWYWPERWTAGFNPLFGGGIGWTGASKVSDVGVADYATGIVTWNWTPPAGATPGSVYRLSLELTFDADWYRPNWHYESGTGACVENRQPDYGFFNQGELPVQGAGW